MAEAEKHVIHNLGPPRTVDPNFKWSQFSFALAFHVLQNTDKYKYVQTFRDQCRLLISELVPLGCSIREIGLLFGSRNCVQKQLMKIQKEENGLLRSPGRPKLFNQIDSDILKGSIEKLHSLKYYPQFYEIQEMVQDMFDVSITADTARYICTEYFGYSTCLAKPKEKARTEVKEKDIDDYYDELKTVLNGVNGRFIINIDETGVCEYVDTQPYLVVTPKDFTSHVSIPVDRSEKRCTGVVAIAPDGNNPKPMIIVNRKTYDSEINFEYPSDGYSIEFQSKSFMTKRLFKKYLKEIILPYFAEKRQIFHYEGKAVIIMDNLKAHEIAVYELQEELQRANIAIQWLVPHSSDQCQMLDVGIFCFQKRKYSHFKPDNRYQKQTRQIIKLLESICESTTKRKCFLAFKQCGIFCDTTSTEYTPIVNVGLARSVRHYQQGYIQSLQETSEKQKEAMQNKFEIETIVKSSTRIKLTKDLEVE